MSSGMKPKEMRFSLTFRYDGYNTRHIIYSGSLATLRKLIKILDTQICDVELADWGDQLS